MSDWRSLCALILTFVQHVGSATTSGVRVCSDLACVSMWEAPARGLCSAARFGCGGERHAPCPQLLLIGRCPIGTKRGTSPPHVTAEPCMPHLRKGLQAHTHPAAPLPSSSSRGLPPIPSLCMCSSLLYSVVNVGACAFRVMERAPCGWCHAGKRTCTVCGWHHAFILCRRGR